MGYNVDESIKKSDFFIDKKLGYRLMKPSEVKNKLGISNYKLKKLEKVLQPIRLTSKTIRYRVEDIFLLAELVK
jgi:hypothetical protein